MHMLDENQIKEYQRQNPKTYGGVAIMHGVQISSTADRSNGFVEFKRNGSQRPENTNYFCVRISGFGYKNLECDRVEPNIQNHGLMFKLNVDNHSTRDRKMQVYLAIFNTQLWRKDTGKQIIQFFLIFFLLCFFSIFITGK